MHLGVPKHKHRKGIDQTDPRAAPLACLVPQRLQQDLSFCVEAHSASCSCLCLCQSLLEENEISPVLLEGLVMP